MSKRYKYTEEDLKFLQYHYPLGNWDEIQKRFPTVSKSGIYSFCSKNGIKSHFDRKELTGNLFSQKWTQEEDAILLEHYEHIPIEDIMQMLPQRSKSAITNRASRKYKLTSFFKSSQLYSDDEINYIKSHWTTQSDDEMAQALGRTQRSVKWIRHELELYRQDPNRDLSYDDLRKYLRGNIYQWKQDSMRNCNYQCVLTGSKNFEIHHLYNFNYIVNEFLATHNIPIYPNINDYSSDQLTYIVDQFIDFHNQYPLGVCVEKQLHKLFHHHYGKTLNTPDQWIQFQEKFKKGIYNH